MSLLALNLGSATLKAASFAFGPSKPGTDAVFQERARIELPAGSDAQQNLTAAVEALPPHARTPDIVIHRIVHGGSLVDGCVLDDASLAVLDALAPLAPLHQPASLGLARAARLRWPLAKHGAAFDTAFHAHLAPWSRRLPVPAELDAAGVRRFGFHGLALASAMRQLEQLAPRVHERRVVLAHLGGGCSVTAVVDGRSTDTTMGMTPQGGLPMPTRTGDLDPGVIFHLLRGGANPVQLEQRLLHHGGLAGIAGHGDVRRLLEDPRPAAVLALAQFAMRIAQSIAAMVIAAGGLDDLVFSGGSGSRSAELRARIATHLHPLGVALDPQNNDAGVTRLDNGHGAAVWRMQVDEELEMAESARAWALPGPAPRPAPQPLRQEHTR